MSKFCSVKSGINTCGICYDQAFFDTKIPQREHGTLPRHELLPCGHGLCENCLEAITSKSSLKCPFCRRGSTSVNNIEYAVSLSLEARGMLNPYEILPEPNKEINTFSDFIENVNNNKEIFSLNSNNIFVILYKQIVYEARKNNSLLKAKKEKQNKLLKQQKEKDKRANSRQSAVCEICNKNTFTSIKQLELHIQAKHKNNSNVNTRRKHYK